MVRIDGDPTLQAAQAGRDGELLDEGAGAVEPVDVAGPAVDGPEGAVLVDGHAWEVDEIALPRGASAGDRRDELARRLELQDHVVARVADVHRALRAALGAVDGDARGILKLAGARAGDTRLAALLVGADLALRLAVLDAPAPGGLEDALLVETLDACVPAIGDVDLAARGRHPDRGLELTGEGTGGAKRADLDHERQDRLERRVGAVRRADRVHGDRAEVIERARRETG